MGCVGRYSDGGVSMNQKRRSSFLEVRQKLFPKEKSGAADMPRHLPASSLRTLGTKTDWTPGVRPLNVQVLVLCTGSLWLEFASCYRAPALPSTRVTQIVTFY